MSTTTTGNSTTQRRPRVDPPNHPAWERAMIGLALAINSLEELASMDPGNCESWTDDLVNGREPRDCYDHQKDTVCQACRLQDLLRDSTGMSYTLDMFLTTLDCNHVSSREYRRFKAYLDDNYAGIKPGWLAKVLRNLAEDAIDDEGADHADGNDNAEVEADEPTAVVACGRTK
jgi:hypothetical protein